MASDEPAQGLGNGEGHHGPCAGEGRYDFSMLDGDVVPEALDGFRAEGSEGLSRQALSWDLTEHRHSEILSSWS